LVNERMNESNVVNIGKIRSIHADPSVVVQRSNVFQIDSIPVQLPKTTLPTTEPMIHSKMTTPVALVCTFSDGMADGIARFVIVGNIKYNGYRKLTVTLKCFE
jgi:hypothetical protein